eukprot:CAMPEP_0115009454 /NCGR_PEP_ID=MMETSP0216-20121206/22629_1 /TAXON_ID=223996 /ORGANISM="Protocruzia adherens, Strain Boccale" /LENGTH=410 /DNA_ID=CAMNT_0002377279 /DNA_START=63 /DNA_END=1295 /DNA_ORIENTATION=-
MSINTSQKIKTPTGKGKSYKVMNEKFEEDQTVFNSMTLSELTIFKENTSGDSQGLSDDSSIISTKPATPDDSPKKRSVKRGRRKHVELNDVEKILSKSRRRGRKARKISEVQEESTMQLDEGCEEFTLEVIPQGIPKSEFRYQNTHKYKNRRTSQTESPKNSVTPSTPKTLTKSQSMEVTSTPKSTLSRTVSSGPAKSEPRVYRPRSSLKNQFDIDNVVVVSESRHHNVDTKNWENHQTITTPEFKFVESDHSKISSLGNQLYPVNEDMEDDGESSDEDVSDEAYMNRHDPKEKEERIARRADEEDKRLQEKLKKSRKRRESQLNREMKAAVKKISTVAAPTATPTPKKNKIPVDSKKKVPRVNTEDKPSALKQKTARKARTTVRDVDVRELLTIRIKLPINEQALPILV